MNKTEIKAGGSVEARSAGAEPPTHEGRSSKCVGEAELEFIRILCSTGHKIGMGTPIQIIGNG